VKSIQQELTESELGKVKGVCYSPWLGLQFFAVLPVFQPSPYSGNSRESNGNSRESGEFPRSSSRVGNSTSLLTKNGAEGAAHHLARVYVGRLLNRLFDELSWGTSHLARSASSRTNIG